MCLLHPSSTYHFPVEVVFDFSGVSIGQVRCHSVQKRKSLGVKALRQ